jgi:hypothetical protein|uniref:Uncharacterized protein n=1 Tax=Picea glauca TaxID=3330 RepID=A0A101M152_PICGL|nr:hypothetical protein ABT39_MTgene4386 [Picea glauca]QHR90782.1 hypothetical protein Q903MT_gene4808 [Picea sitchensis]
MEGPQGRCTATCERMHDLSVEQGRTDSSSGVTIAVAHSRVEVGKCVDGLHHRFTESTGRRLYLCSG